MSRFFQTAHATESYHKRLVNAIAEGCNVLASFPVSVPAHQWYTWATTMVEGLFVVVVPTAMATEQHAWVLQQSGWGFPTVAILDGRQTPLQEQVLRQHLNHHRTSILLTTAQHLSSLKMLEVLVHAPLRAIVIEQAEQLLPGAAFYQSYQRLQQALEQLQRRPTMIALTQPISSSQRKQIAERLHLPMAQTAVLMDFPVVSDSPLMVFKCLNRQAKWQKLRHQILAPATTTHPNTLDEDDDTDDWDLPPHHPLALRSGFEMPLPTLIWVWESQELDWLEGQLSRAGFNPWVLPALRTAEVDGHEATQLFDQMAQKVVRPIFSADDPYIVLAHARCGLDLATMMPAHSHWVFWQCPPTLERLAALAYRRQRVSDPATDTVVLYSKSDWQALQRQLMQLPPQYRRDRDRALLKLDKVREWVLLDPSQHHATLVQAAWRHELGDVASDTEQHAMAGAQRSSGSRRLGRSNAMGAENSDGWSYPTSVSVDSPPSLYRADNWREPWDDLGLGRKASPSFTGFFRRLLQRCLY
jgi:hypothetical protein